MPKRVENLPPTININTQPQAPEQSSPKEPEEKKEKDPRWFFDEIHTFPLQDWGRVWSMELHRMEPKIPGVPGSKGYLTLFLEPITLAAIQARYGGGKFRLNLCKNGRWTRSHDFDIEGQPIYDSSRERPPAAAAAANTDFQKEFIGVLREELQRSREGAQGGAGTDEVVKMLTSASEKAMEIVTKQTPTASSGPAQMREMLTVMKEMGVLGGPSAGGGILEVVKVLKELGVIGGAPTNALDQLTQLGGLIDVVEKIRGGGGGDNPKDWKAMLVQHLPDVLATAKEVLSQNADANARAIEAQAKVRTAEALRHAPRHEAPAPAQTPNAPATSSGPAPAAPAVYVDGELRTVPRGSSADGAADMTPLEPADAPAALDTPANGPAYDQALKIQIVNMLRIGASAETIADFLEDVKPELRADLVKYSIEQITAFFRLDPILKMAVEDPRWDRVLNDARDYIRESEKEVVVN